MPRRSMGFRQSKALDNLHKLGMLTAMEGLGRQTLPDPTCQIPGTGPEKLVYNYLKRLGIRFQFQYHQEDYEHTAMVEELYKPDFILPDYNIRIEVFGEYWHSMPHRRDSDLRKMARHMSAGYMILEHGVPSFPESGGIKGKHVIWWAIEIHYWLNFLFARDLPELLGKDRITGTPDVYILDAEAERKASRARAAGMAARRMRPKVHPLQRQMRNLRRKQIDITRVYPFQRKLERERKQRVPKEFRKRGRKII